MANKKNGAEPPPKRAAGPIARLHTSSHVQQYSKMADNTRRKTAAEIKAGADEILAKALADAEAAAKEDGDAEDTAAAAASDPDATRLAELRAKRHTHQEKRGSIKKEVSELVEAAAAGGGGDGGGAAAAEAAAPAPEAEAAQPDTAATAEASAEATAAPAAAAAAETSAAQAKFDEDAERLAQLRDKRHAHQEKRAQHNASAKRLHELAAKEKAEQEAASAAEATRRLMAESADRARKLAALEQDVRVKLTAFYKVHNKKKKAKDVEDSVSHVIFPILPISIALFARDC